MLLAVILIWLLLMLSWLLIVSTFQQQEITNNYFIFSSDATLQLAEDFLRVSFSSHHVRMTLVFKWGHHKHSFIPPGWAQVTSSQVELTYRRPFNRFDALMLSNFDDLTGTTITSNKPLSVFSGYQCGTPTNDGTWDYLVEQIPPHPTYCDMFLLVPFDVR